MLKVNKTVQNASRMGRGREESPDALNIGANHVARMCPCVYGVISVVDAFITVQLPHTAQPTRRDSDFPHQCFHVLCLHCSSCFGDNHGHFVQGIRKWSTDVHKFLTIWFTMKICSVGIRVISGRRRLGIPVLSRLFGPHVLSQSWHDDFQDVRVVTVLCWSPMQSFYFRPAINDSYIFLFVFVSTHAVGPIGMPLSQHSAQKKRNGRSIFTISGDSIQMTASSTAMLCFSVPHFVQIFVAQMFNIDIPTVRDCAIEDCIGHVLRCRISGTCFISEAFTKSFSSLSELANPLGALEPSMTTVVSSMKCLFPPALPSFSSMWSNDLLHVFRMRW